MEGVTFILRALLFFVALVAAAKIEQAPTLTGLAPPLMPDQDPFYKAPAGFESAKPGTIFRYRLVKDRLTLDNKNGLNVKNMWQILHRTQSALGEPEVNVVTLLEPYNGNPKKLFVYHWFSDAAYNGCNPSITMQVGTRADNEYTQLQNLIVITGLNKGWWVMVPDDGGIKNTFGSGLHVGYTTLDAIRASQNSAEFTKFDPNARIGSYGYSGGGLSAGWFGEVHPLYAPEINIDGIALGGIIPNTTALIDFFNKKAKSSYGPPMLMGLAHEYKNLSDWIDTNVRDDQRENLYKTYGICYDSNFYNYTNMDLGSFFKGGFEDLHSEIPNSVFKWSGTMGLRATPIAPWYMHGTMEDDSSPIHYAEALYDKYCADGARIYFEKNITPLNHSEEMVAGVGGAIAWVSDRLDGIPVDAGCKVVKVQKGYLQGLSDSTTFPALFGNYLVWMGQKIGPSDPSVLDIFKPLQALSPFNLLEKILTPVPGGPGTWFPQVLSTLAPGLMNYVGGAPWSAYSSQQAKQGSQGDGNNPAPFAVAAPLLDGVTPGPSGQPVKGSPRPGQPGPVPSPKTTPAPKPTKAAGLFDWMWNWAYPETTSSSAYKVNRPSRTGTGRVPVAATSRPAFIISRPSRPTAAAAVTPAAVAPSVAATAAAPTAAAEVPAASPSPAAAEAPAAAAAPVAEAPAVAAAPPTAEAPPTAQAPPTAEAPPTAQAPPTAEAPPAAAAPPVAAAPAAADMPAMAGMAGMSGMSGMSGMAGMAGMAGMSGSAPVGRLSSSRIARPKAIKTVKAGPIRSFLKSLLPW